MSLSDERHSGESETSWDVSWKEVLRRWSKRTHGVTPPPPQDQETHGSKEEFIGIQGKHVTFACSEWDEENLFLKKTSLEFSSTNAGPYNPQRSPMAWLQLLEACSWYWKHPLVNWLHQIAAWPCSYPVELWHFVRFAPRRVRLSSYHPAWTILGSKWTSSGEKTVCKVKPNHTQILGRLGKLTEIV